MATSLLAVHQTPHDYAPKLLLRSYSAELRVSDNMARVAFLPIINGCVELLLTVFVLDLHLNSKIDQGVTLCSGDVIHAVLLRLRQRDTRRPEVINVTADRLGLSWAEGVRVIPFHWVTG